MSHCSTDDTVPGDAVLQGDTGSSDVEQGDTARDDAGPHNGGSCDGCSGSGSSGDDGLKDHEQCDVFRTMHGKYLFHYYHHYISPMALMAMVSWKMNNIYIVLPTTHGRYTLFSIRFVGPFCMYKENIKEI